MRVLSTMLSFSSVFLRQPFTDYLTIVLVYVKLTTGNPSWAVVLAPIVAFTAVNAVAVAALEHYKKRMVGLNLELSDIPDAVKPPMMGSSDTKAVH